MGPRGDQRPGALEDQDQEPELHARPHLPEQVRPHRRGAEPDAEADEDLDHARRPGHEDRLPRQPRADRYALPHRRQLGPDLRGRPLQGLAAFGPRDAGARRAVAARGLRFGSAVTAVLDAFRLDGRIALVTGSSAGIGHALAQGLAGAGATVVLNGRDQARLAAAATRLREAGAQQVHTACFDVTSSASIAPAIERIEREIGPIDILVNNAGMQRRAPLEQFAESDWHELMRTNLDSVFLVGQAVARHMIGRRRGKIINVCSVQSELGRPNIAPYTASKGAVKMLTKGMAIDWGPHGLQVNGLGPGYFKTELNEALADDEKFNAWLIGRTPSRRWGEVGDLMGAAVFLASDASAFVNGHVLYVDGGVTATL
ncbi:MAG: SDR family NAD(P)-dependent oxidoreductase [Proteobacteria bacterium]|nr:SDR family NAD(P)-dependent oxidoreductase [Pseudomonadota bacterium]